MEPCRVRRGHRGSAAQESAAWRTDAASATGLGRVRRSEPRPVERSPGDRTWRDASGLCGSRGLSARSGRACPNKRDLLGERAGAFLRPRPSAGLVSSSGERGTGGRTGGSSVPTSQGGGQELRLRAGVNSTVCVSRFQFLIFSLLYLYTVRADFCNAGIKKYIYIYFGVYSGRPLHMLHVPRRD